MTNPQPNPSLPCPNCGGKGTVNGQYGDQPTQNCPFCHGSGVAETKPKSHGQISRELGQAMNRAYYDKQQAYEKAKEEFRNAGGNV